MSSDIHCFNIKDAELIGIDKAVILYNIEFWLQKNKANNRHIHDGYVWTYNSASAFAKLFPYMSTKKISRLLFEMSRDGILISGNFNKAGYDRTKWYTTPNFLISQNQEMDCSKMGNAFLKTGSPIPDVITDVSTDIKKESKDMSSIDDESEKKIIELWNSLGCKRHKFISSAAMKNINSSYKKYYANCKKEKREPSPISNWTLSYLSNGFGKKITDFERKLDDGKWSADLAYAMKPATYEKVINEI